MPHCNLLAIGNELLNGEIRDLNLHWLSRHLTRMGFLVNLAAVVGDRPGSIAAGLAFLLDTPPDILVCCGGLGPTDDDLTLEALADALDRPLTINAQAQHLIEAQYDQLLQQGYLARRGPEPARVKMARLPEGATALPNPVGTAPGVRLEVDDTVLFVLPGVPDELNAIFVESIEPELRRRYELSVWAQGELRVHVDDEAEVTKPLHDVSHRHPGVYLKSLAQPFPAADREGLRIIASTQAMDNRTAEQAIEETLQDLRCTLEESGRRVTGDPSSTPKPSGG